MQVINLRPGAPTRSIPSENNLQFRVANNPIKTFISPVYNRSLKYSVCDQKDNETICKAVK